MDMKKKLLLSMILLALCLIQASADTYYFKINLSDEKGNPGGWSSYIRVDAHEIGKDDKGNAIYDYPNGLKTLLDGGSVKDEGDENGNNTKEYKLPTKTNNNNEVDLDRIYGIVFANGKGRGIGTEANKKEENILEGYEYSAWETIREHIKYLELREYKCDTYNNSGYFMNMHKVEGLELPKDGMKVGDGVEDGQLYFANADNLKQIFIWDGKNDHVDITNNAVKDKKLLNIVGKYMFSNCFNLSTKYINRLIRDVTEIKDNAFYAGEEHRGDFSDEVAGHNIAIEIPSSVTKIGNQAFLNRVKVTGLTINGKNDGSLEIGSEAFRGCDELHDLSLNNAKITSLGTGVFRECRSMTKEFVKGVLENYAANANGEKKIPAYLFYGCNGQGGYANKCTFTELDIPASFTGIDKAAFADNPQVTKVIVHSGTQIDARTYDDKDGIFYGMVPNNVLVEFQGVAESNYTVYRDNIKVDGVDKGKNAFMYLLTKTLDENSTDYTVVAQRHADVRLKRTFKAGWNTLVLPFGARDNGKTVKCARIYQKALNAFEGEGFMIAAYRGLAKNDAQPDNSTFYFLQYANYDTDPLDECEPLLIRMTQKDIDKANGVYTFENVELNYDGDFKDDKGNNIYKEYTAEQVKQRMGKQENGNYFDGNYNHDANDKFKKCTYDDFYFTGTLYKQDTDKNSTFIAPGDYIIQNNTFVKCLLDKKYGLKGFRGYFKQKPSGGTSGGTSGGQSGAKGIGICLVDSNGVVSSIHQVDGVSLTPASVAPAAVYNLSGQKVGNSLSTLAKGVYIVNGKKFVKK